jgi:hypothetical protein
LSEGNYAGPQPNRISPSADFLQNQILPSEMRLSAKPAAVQYSDETAKYPEMYRV